VRRGAAGRHAAKPAASDSWHSRKKDEAFRLLNGWTFRRGKKRRK
jgi:hypothetical protein